MASSFTFKLPLLLEKGPTCKIILRPSEFITRKLNLKKKDIPLIKVSALIDTGASSTAVSQKVVRLLKLVPRGTARVYTSSKTAEIRNEYDVSLEFDHNSYLPLLRVLAANLQNHSIDCLVGRDVLQHGLLIYNGPKKQVTLSF